MAKKDKKLQDPNDYDLSDYELNDRDVRIFKLKQEYPNIRQRELCKLVGINETQFSRIVNKPAYKLAEKQFNKSWIEIILDARKKAAEKIVYHVDSDIGSISLRAAEAILQLDKLDLSQDGDEQKPF